MGEEAEFQIVLATHSPLLMAWPGATLLRIQGDCLLPVRLEDTDPFRLFRDFCEDQKYFMDVWLET
jgi:predicted ATPase